MSLKERNVTVQPTFRNYMILIFLWIDIDFFDIEDRVGHQCQT